MVSLKFYCNSGDGTTIEISTNSSSNCVYFEISTESFDFTEIELNKSTAIKLSKELRKQIALLD